MEAMILAAGEGTRLLPLTLKRPKPLFPVCNLPLLSLTGDYLGRNQIDRLIVNTHHLSDQIQAFLSEVQPVGTALKWEGRYEPEILGTGGGLKNTEGSWGSDPFLVINGDVVTDIPLTPALAFHRDHGGPVTLILHDYPAWNNIRLGAGGQILKFREEGGPWAFTGIHLLNREIFKSLPPVGFYDIIPVYQALIDKGVPVRAYIARDHYWRDVGTPASYRELHREILEGEYQPGMDFPGRSTRSRETWCVHPGALVDQAVRLEGWGAIGDGCRVSKGCCLRNSILWQDVQVEAGATIEDSIVSNGIIINNKLINSIY